MKVFSGYGVKAITGLAAVAVLFLFTGCNRGSDQNQTQEQGGTPAYTDTARTPAPMDTVPRDTIPQDTIPRDTIPRDTVRTSSAGQVAGTTADLAAWESYSNPAAGQCPVCEMKLEPAHVQVAEISGKKYACCSTNCATKLTENPAKFLSAAAEAGSHEGHTH